MRIQIHPLKQHPGHFPPKIQYIETNYIESLIEQKEVKEWELKMLSGEIISISLNEFLRKKLL